MLPPVWSACACVLMTIVTGLSVTASIVSESIGPSRELRIDQHHPIVARGPGCASAAGQM
jgi:hypothetical protein